MYSIMNEYEKKEAELERIKCPVCNGIGKCNDAGFGDIGFNEW